MSVVEVSFFAYGAYQAVPSSATINFGAMRQPVF